MNLTKRSLELHTSIDPLSGTTRKIEGQGQLYWSETFFMERNAGLFFLVKGNDFLEWEGALRFLTDFGFGGDNSSGKGFFDYQIKPFDINTPENARHSVLLSLYNPTAIELGQIKEMSTETTYELITRKGKIGTHFNNTGNFQKDAIISFTEGSVIPVVNPTGRLQVVAQSPQHPIYHNSLAFSFPIALNA